MPTNSARNNPWIMTDTGIMNRLSGPKNGDHELLPPLRMRYARLTPNTPPRPAITNPSLSRRVKIVRRRKPMVLSTATSLTRSRTLIAAVLAAKQQNRGEDVLLFNGNLTDDLEWQGQAKHTVAEGNLVPHFPAKFLHRACAD